MSWSFSGTATTKKEALDDAVKNAATQVEYVPDMDMLMDSMMFALSLLPELGSDDLYNVQTDGHVDKDTGFVNVRATTLKKMK